MLEKGGGAEGDGIARGMQIIDDCLFCSVSLFVADYDISSGILLFVLEIFLYLPLLLPFFPCSSRYLSVSRFFSLSVFHCLNLSQASGFEN